MISQSLESFIGDLEIDRRSVTMVFITQSCFFDHITDLIDRHVTQAVIRHTRDQRVYENGSRILLRNPSPYSFRGMMIDVVAFYQVEPTDALLFNALTCLRENNNSNIIITT